MNRIGLLLTAVWCAACGGRDAAIVQGLDVPTAQGLVSGSRADGVRSWKGVPYAAPPVGPLRFRPPAAPTAWSGPRDATEYGNQCPQASLRASLPSGAEDCLVLNVFTPDPAPDKALPVMVWIHGGALLVGAGHLKLYEPSALVRTGNVVVVSINYRLGALGFLAHPSVLAEDPQAGTGNLGLLDQRAALSWVRDNIHAFGGDPGNVTIFGESAGAWSVTWHLAAPGSKGLFHRAIIQSGATPATAQLPTLDEAQLQAEALGQRLGCTGDLLACLRGKPVSELVTGLPSAAPHGGGLFQGVVPQPIWPLVVDGVTFTEQPASAFGAGRVNVVPTLLGSNANEGTAFHMGMLGDRSVADDAAYTAALQAEFGAHAAAVAARYPVAASGSADKALAKVDTDAIFTCPTRTAARALSAAGAPVFRYYFVRTPDTGLAASIGTTHGTELPYVFGNDDDVAGGVTDSAELRTTTMSAWARFAATGHPDPDGKLGWPAYDAATDPMIVMNLPVSSRNGVSTDACDFWDGLPGWKPGRWY